MALSCDCGAVLDKAPGEPRHRSKLQLVLLRRSSVAYLLGHYTCLVILSAEVGEKFSFESISLFLRIDLFG